MRYLRTLRRLSPRQVAHRIRLRARRGLAGERRGAVPAAGAGPGLPADLLRPCAPAVSRSRAREVCEGTYRFVGIERSLGSNPFARGLDAPLLWAYQLAVLPGM